MSRRTVILKHFKVKTFRAWLKAVEKMYPSGFKVADMALWLDDEDE